MEAVVGLMQMTNQYLNASAFWKSSERKDQHRVVGTAAEALRVMSILLYPIIPRYSETVMRYFKVRPEERRLERCKIKADAVVRYDPKATDTLFIKKLKHNL